MLIRNTYKLFFTIMLILFSTVCYQTPDTTPGYVCYSSPVNVNFNRLKVFVSGVRIYTERIGDKTVQYRGGFCNSNIIHFKQDNPSQINHITLKYKDANSFKFVVVELFNGERQSATIDVNLDTFTEIVGDHFRIVPVRS